MGCFYPNTSIIQYIKFKQILNVFKYTLFINKNTKKAIETKD